MIYSVADSGRKTEIAPMKEFPRDSCIPSSPGGLEAGRCVAQIGHAWWRFNVDAGVYTNYTDLLMDVSSDFWLDIVFC